MLVNSLTFESFKKTKLSPGVYQVDGLLEYPFNGFIVAVDPGVNFGITVIDGRDVHVIHGKLQSDKRAGWRGIYAYTFLMNMFYGRQREDALSIVEGASYHSQFGQVALEEVRFGFFFALHNLIYHPVIVPPATIRKVAFGDGKQQAGDLFPLLNHNAADSLGAALYLLEKNAD